MLRPTPSKLIAFYTTYFLLIGISLFSFAGCGGGESNVALHNDPPPIIRTAPSQLISKQGKSFDEFSLEWLPPTTAIAGYELEAALPDGPFERVLDSYLSMLSSSVELRFNSETPEMLSLRFRIRAVTNTGPSAYSNEASYLRGVRPPKQIEAALSPKGGILISASKNWGIADGMQLERATIAPDGTPGSWRLLFTTTPNNAYFNYEDHDLVEGTRYQYRAYSTYSTQRSLPLEATVGPAPLSSVTDFKATLKANAVHLEWKNRTQQDTIILIYKILGTTDNYYHNDPAIIATLPGSATSFDDPIMDVARYTYFIETVLSENIKIKSPKLGILATLPNSISLETSIPQLPNAPWALLGPNGSTVIGANQDTRFGFQIFDSNLWVSYYTIKTNANALFNGISLDQNDNPHLITHESTNNNSTTSLYYEYINNNQLLFRDTGIKIFSTPSSQHTFTYQQKMDRFGNIHVVCSNKLEYPQPYISTDLYYVSNKSGVWDIKSLNLGQSIENVRSVELSIDYDGHPHVIQYTSAGSIHHFFETPSGSWTYQSVPLGSIVANDGFAGSVFTKDGDGVLFIGHRPPGFFQGQLYSIWKRGGTWGIPQRLSSISAFTHLALTNTGVSRDGSRVGISFDGPTDPLLYLTDGTRESMSMLDKSLILGRIQITFDRSGLATILGPAWNADGTQGGFILQKEKP